MTKDFFDHMDRVLAENGAELPEVTFEEAWAEIALTETYAPRVLPVQWTRHPFPIPAILLYRRYDGLKVLFSATKKIHDDPRAWLHVSLSRKNRIPSYEDMVCVKKLFVGEDRQAIQVFAPRAKHVNIGPNVLHLWCCLDGDGLPDFGKYKTI